MYRYASKRHRRMMDESLRALNEIAESTTSNRAAVIKSVLQDKQLYAAWMVGHAELLRPVAKHKSARRQILALRRAEVGLVHRRALFQYVLSHRVRGERRRRLFRVHHSTLDESAAMVAEHRQYLIATASSVCTNHLIELMHDPISQQLLGKYTQQYTNLFATQCAAVAAGDGTAAQLLRSTMEETRERVRHLRKRIESERPAAGCGSFDREEALARSGRYPALNYLAK